MPHPTAGFPEYRDDNRRIWDANACWGDDQIGDGNELHVHLRPLGAYSL